MIEIKKNMPFKISQYASRDRDFSTNEKKWIVLISFFPPVSPKTTPGAPLPDPLHELQPEASNTLLLVLQVSIHRRGTPPRTPPLRWIHLGQQQALLLSSGRVAQPSQDLRLKREVRVRPRLLLRPLRRRRSRQEQRRRQQG